MKLFEAILDANHRAVSGDGAANLPLDGFAGVLAFGSPAGYTPVP
jgi:hypothetical protein